MKKLLVSLKPFLDEQAEYFESRAFIDHDPISIPHRFSNKRDIEIAAFLTATIAWGNRKSIITNAESMMHRMDHEPFQFIKDHSEKDLKRFDGFVHRTFNADDIKCFLRALKNIYLQFDDMEAAFNQHFDGRDVRTAIMGFREIFFTVEHEQRSQKHVSNPATGSSAKRLNMFLRWMVRDASKGVDFGLWTSFNSSQLYIPLDVHTGNISRELKLLKRKQNDWTALEELMNHLRQLDPQDPVKYDFALFGIGVTTNKKGLQLS
jgi:uncharacterized protein (TIGR02757 family)